MPLNQAPADSVVIIRNVGGEEHNRRHLECLGVTKGEKIKIVDSHGGAVIVKVKGYRLALDKVISSKIDVDIYGGTKNDNN
ncbi:MAG: FeoA family protein [Bacilli bacterium]